jgi:hypothetical protein
MKLTSKQLAELVELTQTVRQDTIGCDGCFELLDQLAQAERDGTELGTALLFVRNHIAQCKCCRDEYDALLTALDAIDN